MTKLAENIAKNDSRNLWKEISKLRGHSKLSPPHVDGVTDAKEITDLFKNKYETLYNSSSSNIDHIHECINSAPSQESDAITISKQLVNKAICYLKCDKNDGDKNLWSTLVVETPQSWRYVLAKLIQSMISHAHYA